MASLKTFIKAVRKAKTIADERAVVRKELALIRTSFRDATLDQTTRRINISKLLYLYIMGEKTHFGQVECLKVLALPRFADKRLGYLATMLFLDENQEVLTLLTNSLDNDMQHPNAFIVGLALCCLGNIALPELARDLYTNVEKIIQLNNVYLKKKAAIVAAKLVEKEPELAEYFLPRVTALINEKAPATLLGTCRLIQSLYAVGGDTRPTLIKTIPKIVDHLKRVSSSGYMPDYDVLGLTDPFLQVTLLTTLRILATDPNCPREYLEQINDILTQVASNLDSGKNAAHAILYECVKTIFAIQADQSLRILGVNILGKFLSTKDNNTRYVALDTLLTVINIEPLAVQRHRSTIVSCLSDGDVSIRRRALELTFVILNEQNVRVLVREILTFLENTDSELKPFITTQLTIAAAKFAPNEKWHFDTLIRMLKVAGNHVNSDIVSNILAFLLQCNDGDLKKHVVGRLIASSLEDFTQYGLALITVWTIGEYADLVLGSEVEVSGKNVILTEKILIQLIDDMTNNSTYSERESVQLVTYILTTVLKLLIKFKSAEHVDHLRRVLNSRTHDNNLEIQIRAVEYQEIFGQSSILKKGLLARMPAPPIKQREAITLNSNSSARTTKIATIPIQATTQDLLLDLMDDNDVAERQPEVSRQVDESDLLSDIFSNPAPIQNSPAETVPTSAITAFSNQNIQISFLPKLFTEGNATAEIYIQSKSSSTIEQVQLFLAVPKAQKLTMSTTSGDVSISPGGNPIKQVLKIVGKAGAKIKLRVKAAYVLNGVNVEDQFDFGGFEKTL